MNNAYFENNDSFPTLLRNTCSLINNQSEIDGLLDGKTDSTPKPIAFSESKTISDAACKPPTGCRPSQLLPVDFKPDPCSVLIGRGKAFTEAVGNRRLNVRAATFLPAYAKTTSKNEKSLIVTRLVEMVQDACPRGGAFVKLAGGRWWEVDGHTARQKVGSVLRELLHDKYRSSSKSKVEKRRQQREVKRAEWIASKKKAAEHINATYLANIDATGKVSSMIQSSFHNLVTGSLSSSSHSSSLVDEMRMSLPKGTEASKSVAANGLKSSIQPSGRPADRLLQKQLSVDCITNLYAKDCTGQPTGGPADRLLQKHLSDPSISYRNVKDLRMQTPWDLLSPHGSSGTNSTFHDVQSIRELNTSSNKHTNTPASSSSSSSLKPLSLVAAWSHTMNSQQIADALIGNQDRLGCDDEDDISKIFE